MIPSGGTITGATLEIKERPSLTWKMDAAKGRIIGRLDGLEAVKQAAFKILETPRYHYLIYTANYGSELETLIGMNPTFLRSEAARMIREALTQDDRITGVENIRITNIGDSLLIECTVISNYGRFEMTQEVSM
ncbi:Protein of unknown function (DUF2634) [Desulfosporosinus orientis DSM 765]|uniref:DUF2634 domain-containing protein n=1 Tax=Desulfosporosinus orientis (strain ATCC 19365 / DSM 765 / NCIMB 8382 / VKM B-1628 / Singapore I) TaxID=768706 RepID=G7WEE6_DESOD|nr:DUF2634 domain-containing protein [Desulfosporosinus orientis]AET70759.1 Protein of unknown function (DUF2634) [Desulfosporosinus orientis DSM 765]